LGELGAVDEEGVEAAADGGLEDVATAKCRVHF